MKEFHDVFESKPLMPGEKFKITLVEDGVPCRVTKANKVPVSFMDPLKEELDGLLKENIIRQVKEPTEWVNPIVVEPKKDKDGNFNGKVHLCVDFQKGTPAVHQNI